MAAESLSLLQQGFLSHSHRLSLGAPAWIFLATVVALLILAAVIQRSQIRMLQKTTQAFYR